MSVAVNLKNESVNSAGSSISNIQRWRLRRGGRILRQFSHLVSELGDLFGQFRILLDKRFIDFNKFSNLFFKFRNAANIELFCFSSQVLSSSLPTRLLSDKYRALLETNIDITP
jgi:hypothetical protein